MPLVFAYGVNHQRAPVSLRERVSFAPERLPEALKGLAGCDGVCEAAILSTCNRTDLYCGLADSDGATAAEWLARYHGLSARECDRYFYAHRSEAAVRHLMRVAAGLDSMVIGEPQILGQVKGAYHAALETGTLGQVLGRLFQHSFSVAKRVRTDTGIGSSPVSVAFAAVSLARHIFGDLGPYTALMVGAGETVELAARHLRANGIGRMVIANRTAEAAHRLAAQFNAYGISLGEAHAHLAEADILFTSTASPEPVIRLEDVREAFRKRNHRPMFIVDIAVPRDVEPAVGKLEDVYLYTVDDLRGVIERNLQSREQAARQAEEIIEAQVSHFMGWLGTLETVATIRAFRGEAERARDEALARARRMVRAGAPPEAALEYLARTLTNKLLHAPTVEVRRAGALGREDLIDAAQRLFRLDAGEDDHPSR